MQKLDRACVWVGSQWPIQVVSSVCVYVFMYVYVCMCVCVYVESDVDSESESSAPNTFTVQ